LHDYIILFISELYNIIHRESIGFIKKEFGLPALFFKYQGGGQGRRSTKYDEAVKRTGHKIIVNFQSFNCALNYVTRIGLVKESRRQYPAANILDIDYAPGIPAVNRINRIRLLLSKAKKEIKAKESQPVW
jgi:predicted nucleotide-binding protein (sugar kinase/HSP70/actin superfamily)